MVSAATLFPNLSLVHNWPQVDDAADVPPFISLRQWQPVCESETEVLSWFAVDRNAPADFKQASYKAYLMCFGSSGMFEQDDVENWVLHHLTARAAMARRLLLNSGWASTADGRPLTSHWRASPARASPSSGFGEYNQRSWLALWCDAPRDGAAPGRSRSPAACAGGPAAMTAGRTVRAGAGAPERRSPSGPTSSSSRRPALLDARRFTTGWSCSPPTSATSMPVAVTTSRGAWTA